MSVHRAVLKIHLSFLAVAGLCLAWRHASLSSGDDEIKAGTVPRPHENMPVPAAVDVSDDLDRPVFKVRLQSPAAPEP